LASRSNGSLRSAQWPVHILRMLNRRHPIATRTTRPGLTLVEVLVVVAILAILLGILAPVMRSARRQGDDLVCRSRQSAISRMFSVYATEHDGLWPTFDYPHRLTGEPDALRLDSWGASGGWFILPINEMTFWGFPLRDYAVNDSARAIPAAVEALSCPTVFNRWLDQLPAAQRDGRATIVDPMWAPQESYYHSLALFTRPGGWAGAPNVPVRVNPLHAPVSTTQVRYPSRKASLVEKASYHERRRGRIEEDSSAHFNVLAADGHVERMRADDAAAPRGFTAVYTGFEVPRQRSDQHAEDGIRYVSTSHGALGRDW